MANSETSIPGKEGIYTDIRGFTFLRRVGSVSPSGDDAFGSNTRPPPGWLPQMIAGSVALRRRTEEPSG